jgi:hypothetical protein
VLIFEKKKGTSLHTSRYKAALSLQQSVRGQCICPSQLYIFDIGRGSTRTLPIPNNNNNNSDITCTNNNNYITTTTSLAHRLAPLTTRTRRTKIEEANNGRQIPFYTINPSKFATWKPTTDTSTNNDNNTIPRAGNRKGVVLVNACLHRGAASKVHGVCTSAPVPCLTG